MKDRCRTNNQRRLWVFSIALAQPRQPGQGLKSFAQAHIVGQDSAEFEVRQMTEEIETLLLVRPQLRCHLARKFGTGDTFEYLEALAERSCLRGIGEALPGLGIEMRRLFQGDS